MVKVKKNHWLPQMLNVTAITLYPYILFAGETDLITLQHEFIHVRQVREKGWLWFYFDYLFQYFLNRVDGMDADEAYMCITYELEAYDNEESTPITEMYEVK